MEYYLQVWRDYVDFSGRSRRKEYWFWYLGNSLISLLFALLLGATLRTTSIFQWIYWLYGLAIILPSWAVTVRRLHDTGRSGWHIFIVLIPLVGAILMLIYMFQDSQPGSNAYGPNPKESYIAAAG